MWFELVFYTLGALLIVSVFLVVAVGEFNAGKSAVINALLGEKVL